MLTGGETNQLAALGIYLIWQMVLVLFYKQCRKVRDGKWIFYLVSLLSLLPIIFVKMQLAINGLQSLLGFVGISYLTFRSVGIIIELRDGVIKDLKMWDKRSIRNVRRQGKLACLRIVGFSCLAWL